MNEQLKRRGFAHNKILATVALSAMFLGGSPMFAADVVPGTLSAMEQQQTINVTVTVNSNEGPVVGANVVQKGTTNGGITDFNGVVNLDVPRGSVLQISFIGYKTQEVKVTGSKITVNLVEDSELLEEVVVVGYGTQKKANLTGAVSTVDVAKTMEGRPQSDVSKALQGVVPGLTVVSSSGSLGASPTLTIRGTGTLSNGAVSNPLIIVDGVQLDDLSLLNPDDIASISVLKDAASTSIYGARAAFGVILVTTKGANKTERVTVNYSNNFSWSTPTMLPEYPDVATQARALGAANKRQGVANELFGMYLDEEFITAAEAWKKRHGGKAGYREMVEGDDFYISESGTPVYVADWDVTGIMFQDWKPAQKHNVSLQGTSGKTSYYLSFGFNKDEGVMAFNPEKLKRYNVTMNVTSDVTDWLQIGGRFSYNDRKFNAPNTRRYTYQYMWRWGSFFGPYGTYQGIDMRNDIAYRKQAGDQAIDNAYTRIGGFAKAKIIKGLTLNADYTVAIQNRDYLEEGLPVYCWNSWGGQLNSPSYASAPSSSYITQQSNKNQSYALNVFANYEFTLAKNHNFNVMVGANAEEGTRRMHYSKRIGLLDSNLPEFDLATGTQTVDGSHSEWGTAGWFGRINYDWNGIWLLELNGRYDGSSSFPASDRWAFFPSGSMGYRFSEEAYFAPLKKVVSNGKLRGSFGEIGNEAIGSNMFVSTISATTVNWLDGSTKLAAYGLPSLVSSTLKWERIQTLDLGLDLGFLNGDLNASFDWYQRTTKDMLAPAKTMPQVLGASAPYVNAGELRTRGWELTLDYHHTFQNLDNLSVYGNFSIGDFTTEITKWDNDSKLLNSNYSGKNYGDIWGFVTEGIFKDEADVANHADQSGLETSGFKYGVGDIKFKDLDGNKKIDGGKGTLEDHGDLKVIGNTLPRYQYSFRLGGSWKGFDLDMFFQGVGKCDIWSTGAFVIPMSRGADAIYANQTDYWSEENPNPNAFYPRMWAGNASKGTISVIEAGCHNFYPQTRYLIDASYLRFKNITLGYTLPKSLTKKAFMEKVRVYVSADNVCELINNSYAPVDPEVNTTENGSLSNGTWGRIDPMYRTISFGLQVTL